MAEMTAAECIAALHNNQYQKHIGNGEYDYIHPLTDAQAKGIESLIEQQAAEIERLKADVCNMATMSDAHVKMIYEYKERRDAELAAANARIAELHDDEAMEKMYQDGLHNGAIEANKQLTEARATIDTHSELIEHYKQKAEQAEAENKRMRDALEMMIDYFDIDSFVQPEHALEKVQAALEGK